MRRARTRQRVFSRGRKITVTGALPANRDSVPKFCGIATSSLSARRWAGYGCPMMRRFACAGQGVIQWALVGFPKANASDGTPREPRLIGRVAMVNEEGHFVLVQCDAWKTPQEGTALK